MNKHCYGVRGAGCGMRVMRAQPETPAIASLKAIGGRITVIDQL